MRQPLRALSFATALFVSTCASPSLFARDFNPLVKPYWLGIIETRQYDGVNDDLLTAGLGKTGLGGAAPTVSDPNDPTQLRRLAIWTNYRAILDITPTGGYGTLYGPNVRADGTITFDEGRIAGTEYAAYADNRDGGPNVTLLVQVPTSFDPTKPCIVTGTSSGSRGIYGAIGSSGEWGLKRGCAVAYTDKGGGLGVHDLHNNTVNLRNGVRADAVTAGDQSNFTAPITNAQRQQFDAATPYRVAVKHAHSQRNPENDWGRDTLRAVEMAFYVLNRQFASTDEEGRRMRPRASIRPDNTIVIASSVSNGAGAALVAAEQDRFGLIDGVAVTEPNVQVDLRRPLVVRRGGVPDYTGGARALLDYFTYANLYQPCAALAERAQFSAQPFPQALVPLARNRCESLAAKGLLASSTLGAQAEEALDKLLAYGWEPDTIALQVSHWRFATPAIVMTYANSYGEFSVLDRLCGLSFAFTDATTGMPVAPNVAALSTIFATGNGIPPTAGINIVNDNSVGGPRLDLLSVSPSTNKTDFNIDGAICQRNLITHHDENARRVQRGIREVRVRGDLNGKPAIIVHGRADTLIPVNFSSRPYYAANLRREGERGNVRYIEVTNAQHFDAFLPFPDYAARFVPLHVYLNRALDAMYARLTIGTSLPPSQVVHTTPRGLLPISWFNVPNWSQTPTASERIVFDGTTLFIPE
ncbi:MAG TPA: 3-hydroxybutyrate oligomer hydrolase family protein [Burkholderiaceae bacterium]|nr:3-hydroxybutyrate oligomer hydrolase family protein [Burkholderiaceae bacterium]